MPSNGTASGLDVYWSDVSGKLFTGPISEQRECDPHGVGLIFQLAPLVVKELAKANASDWLWQIQSGSGQTQ